MARPERHDADYFPFYCKDGRTLFILETKYGCKGTGFFTNVMRVLTTQPDHHLCIQSEAEKMYFFSKTKCDEEAGTDMLNIMAKTGKIDSDLWITHQVVVSQDLLNSLNDAYKNRNNKIITIDIIRISYPVMAVSYHDNTEHTGFTPPQEPVSYPDNPQRKGKERKGKESNAEVSYPENPIDDSPILTGQEKAAPLKKQETTKLQSLINQVKTKHPKLPIDTWYGSNHRAHPDAITHVLRSLLSADDDVRYGIAYLNKALAIENGKYNARDEEAAHTERNRPVKGELEAFGNILGRIAAKGGENERSP